jgi:hypothetical protein
MTNHHHNEFTLNRYHQEARLQEAEQARLAKAAQSAVRSPHLARRALSATGDLLISAGTRLKMADDANSEIHMRTAN